MCYLDVSVCDVHVVQILDGCADVSHDPRGLCRYNTEVMQCDTSAISRL